MINIIVGFFGAGVALGFLLTRWSPRPQTPTVMIINRQVAEDCDPPSASLGPIADTEDR